MKYLLVDTETTGLDATRHSVIEIAALPLAVDLNPEPAKPFHCLVRPAPYGSLTKVIDKKAIEINHHDWVYDDDCDTYKNAAEDPKWAWSLLLQYMKTTGWDPDDRRNKIVLAGWNPAFDRKFLWEMFLRAHKEQWSGHHKSNVAAARKETIDNFWPFHYHVMDFLAVCRYLDARKGITRKSYRLEHMAKELCPHVFEKYAAHCATGDIYAAMEVLQQVEGA